MRKSLVVYLLALLASFTPLAASAAPTTVPTSLNPGDQYRLSFVTSGTRDALSTDIADYNSFVTSAAVSVPELAALLTTWRVIGSTGSINARDNTETNPSVSAGFSIFRLDGTKIAASNSDLWDGSILAPINLSETMGTVSSRAATGTNVTGSKEQSSLYPLGPLGTVAIGNPQQVNSGWVTGAGIDAHNQMHFYAISGILTVPVPEPSSLILGSFTVAGLAVVAVRKRRARRLLQFAQ